MKKWEYAIHSHDVKKFGGPEKYIAAIRLYEHQITSKSLNIKWICGMASVIIILSPFVKKGISTLIKEYKEKTISNEETKQAKNNQIPQQN